MHHNAILCFRCVHPHALNYRCYASLPPFDLDRRRPCAGPPSNLRGEIADRDLRCTWCRSTIPEGYGYVRLRNLDRAETQGTSAAHPDAGPEKSVRTPGGSQAPSWFEPRRRRGV